jgi:uncharacterized protein
LIGGIHLVQNVRVKSQEVELIATLHYPQRVVENNERVPLIIICHGFVGNRIGVNRLFVKAANHFASNGFAVLRFDYEGCGESPGEYGSYGLERFIEQTRDVVTFVSGLEFVDPDQLILLGHSLGGAVTALTAGIDRRVKKLILWSAVGQPFHDIVNIVGYDEYQKTSVNPFIDHEGYALTNQFFSSLRKYNPLKACQAFSGDVFLAHGNRDDVIPVDYCFLYDQAFKLGQSRNCSKEVILGADHVYSTIGGSKQLFNRTLDFLLSGPHVEKWATEAV